MQKNPWTIISSSQVYDNKWICVTAYEVLNPSGGEGIYGKVHFKNLAVGVVPIDDEGHIYLVGQFRFPLDQYSWEIPEGGCALDEAPVDAAKRELKEETGIEAQHWEKILDMHLSNSVSDETGFIFLASGLKFFKAEPEGTEQITVKKYLLKRPTKW